jgi:hypothetical protein
MGTLYLRVSCRQRIPSAFSNEERQQARLQPLWIEPCAHTRCSHAPTFCRSWLKCKGVQVSGEYIACTALFGAHEGAHSARRGGKKSRRSARSMRLCSRYQTNQIWGQREVSYQSLLSHRFGCQCRRLTTYKPCSRSKLQHKAMFAITRFSIASGSSLRVVEFDTFAEMTNKIR